ncbi:ribosomal L7Ae/L30e/S12e/Gadd45 family protein [Zhaonella formicivorans]|jgi:large subunit ribosomal protein L7A|uniref:ribosomal L7Ae/L30e/S12e/Gadd45 family protein n=1 Tax=Zhaonella formicivorans TaxID=2528593 RepID=UPI0010E0927F|nr:ribosomal L7Ae/L30e/S12e/Gadd45 family protein [Zhaonella formicivorans]
MPYERLKKAAKKTIGTKQTTKAVQKGTALVVYVAKDAEPRVVNPLLRLCAEKGIEVVTVDSMLELGKACGIEVGSASAAIVSE